MYFNYFKHDSSTKISFLFIIMGWDINNLVYIILIYIWVKKKIKLIIH